MKKEDIFEALGDIDADVVLSAAPKMPARKKSTFVLRLVAVAACIALLVSTVVVSTLLLNREDENQPDVPTEIDEKAKYVMYIDHFASVTPVNPIENDSYTVEIRDQNGISFSLSDRNKIDRQKETTDTLSINLLDKNWTLNYSRTFSVGLDKSDRFSHLGVYTEYRADGKIVDVNSVTNEIIYLSDLNAEVDIDGDFTEEDAMATADKMLGSLYGDKILEYYEEPISVESLSGEKDIYILYQKNVYGYSTTENILIKFNRNGDLLSINALKKGTMERVEQDITKEQVDSAFQVLKDQYTEAKISMPQILLASDGNYYLSAYVVIENIPMYVYINIE